MDRQIPQQLDQPDWLDEEAANFYGGVLETLRKGDVPLLVGGGFAFSTYTGIARDTKDFDIFIMPGDLQRVLELLQAAGYETDNKYPHWLAKVHQGSRVVDLIFSSGNGTCPVDQEWFDKAVTAHVLGHPVKLMAPEEMIWQKAFIMERHRFDGADVIHLIHFCRERIDWDRLIRRFGSNWLVLMSHLLLYRFVYPYNASQDINRVLLQFAIRLQNDLANDQPVDNGKAPLCRGTLLSLLQYLPAVRDWGYRDARIAPDGTLSDEEIKLWTNTFER